MNDTQSAFDSEFLKKLEYLYIVSKKIFAGRIKAERRSTRRGRERRIRRLPQLYSRRRFSIHRLERLRTLG